MKKKWITLAVFTALLSCTLKDPVYNDLMYPQVEASYRVVSGLVSDAQGKPVKDAVISLEDGRTTLSDSDGFYSLSLPAPGTYVITVEGPPGLYGKNAVVKAEDCALQTVHCSFVLLETEGSFPFPYPVTTSITETILPIPTDPGTVMTLYSATSEHISEISYSYTMGTEIHPVDTPHPLKEVLLEYMEAEYGCRTMERKETVPVNIEIPRGIGLKMNSTQTVYDIVCQCEDLSISARMYSTARVSLINYHREDFAGGN